MDVGCKSRGFYLTEKGMDKTKNWIKENASKVLPTLLCDLVTFVPNKLQLFFAMQKIALFGLCATSVMTLI